ncbi:hypothetical protein C8Q74DRAFT_1407674 [Fomes fomentarius]|nr:hypothetical protein C8Q74DRAFT_1407674 [Fomes fomentarius]
MQAWTLWVARGRSAVLIVLAAATSRASKYSSHLCSMHARETAHDKWVQDKGTISHLHRAALLIDVAMVRTPMRAWGIDMDLESHMRLSQKNVIRGAGHSCGSWVTSMDLQDFHHPSMNLINAQQTGNNERKPGSRPRARVIDMDLYSGCIRDTCPDASVFDRSIRNISTPLQPFRHHAFIVILMLRGMYTRLPTFGKRGQMTASLAQDTIVTTCSATNGRTRARYGKPAHAVPNTPYHGLRSKWESPLSKALEHTPAAAYSLLPHVCLQLLLTLYAVRRVPHREQMHKWWGVGDILCIQGIGYVAITCLVNVPVAVLAILDLNARDGADASNRNRNRRRGCAHAFTHAAGMDVLLSLPAMTFSVIASSFALLVRAQVQAPKVCLPSAVAVPQHAKFDWRGHPVVDGTRLWAGLSMRIPMTSLNTTYKVKPGYSCGHGLPRWIRRVARGWRQQDLNHPNMTIINAQRTGNGIKAKDTHASIYRHGLSHMRLVRSVDCPRSSKILDHPIREKRETRRRTLMRAWVTDMELESHTRRQDLDHSSMTLNTAQQTPINARKPGSRRRIPVRAWVSHTRLVRGVDRPRCSKTSTAQASMLNTWRTTTARRDTRPRYGFVTERMPATTISSHVQRPTSFKEPGLFDFGHSIAQDMRLAHSILLDAGPEVRSTGLVVVPGAGLFVALGTSTREFCGEANVRRNVCVRIPDSRSVSNRLTCKRSHYLVNGAT